MKKAQAIKAVADRLVDVSEVDNHVNILLYGRNGQGKTRTEATLPKPMVIADVNEKGTKSIRNYGKKVKVFPVANFEDAVYFYWFLKAGKHPFKSFGIDTITMLQMLCIKHVLKEDEDRDPNKDPKTMSQRSWGKVAEYMKPLLLDFRNLPMHCCFVAQERTIENAEEETTERVPDLSPGSRAVATACVDIIGRIYQKEVRTVDKKKTKEVSRWETRMLVGPHEEYITKDRTGELPRIVRNPDLTKILNLEA